MIKKFIPSIIISVYILSFSTVCFPIWFPSETSKVRSTGNQKNSKKRLNNPHSNKLLKDMTEQELIDMLLYAKSLNDREFVFKVFHYLLSHSSNQNNLKSYKLDLADYCFTIKDFEKAAISYEDFSVHYPGCAEIEYAQYKCIISWFAICLEPSRDQSLTNKVIFLIDEYLRKATNKKFIEEVTTIRKKCRQKLFDHEVHVFEHYLKQKKIKSAQARQLHMQEQFKDIEHIEHYVQYCNQMIEIVKDPKRCPFFITFNLKDALPANVVTTPEKKAKTALFFLS